MGICYDGMLSEEYNNAPVKIVWVLKEALYDGKLSEQLEHAIKNKYFSFTWLTMAYSAYAVINGWTSAQWKEVPTLDQGVLEILRKVAVVNVKKEACTAPTGLSDNAEIIAEYFANRDAIKKQILDLDAAVIVFGYPEKLRCIVEDIFKNQTAIDYHIDKHFGDFASTVAEVNGKRRLFLWGYHPGYYRSEENSQYSQYNYFKAFVDVVSEFRGMK